MFVLTCKIWPLFKKILGKRYPFLRWNQEIFNFLKQPFFSKSRKKVKTFQRTPIFKKTRKIHHIYKYSQVHNTKTICLIELFQRHSNWLIIACCTITDSLKTIDSWQISRKLKIWYQNIPLFGEFHEMSSKKHPPYHDFAKLALKYPYFREIWNTH